MTALKEKKPDEKDQALTLSLNALPALKTGVLLAANSIASPVAGLRP